MKKTVPATEQARVALGRKIAEARAHKGVSKAEIVRRASFLSYRYVDCVEKGDANYSIDTLSKYLNAIDLTLEVKGK